MNTNQSFLSLRDIVTVLFKRLPMIVTITIAAAVSGLLYVLLMWPTFESYSLLMVRRNLPETENLTIAQATPQPATIIRQVSQTEEINTLIAVMKSQDLIAEVVDEMGLTFKEFDKVEDYRRYVKSTYRAIREFISLAWSETKIFIGLSKRLSPEEIEELNYLKFLRVLSEAIIVEQVPDTEAIQLGVRCSSPVIAKNFSAAYAEKAIPWYLKKIHQNGSYHFYKAQADATQQNVQELESKIREIQNEYSLIGLEDKKRLLVNYQFEAKVRLNDIRARSAALNAGLSRLKTLMNEEPKMMETSRKMEKNPIRQKMSSELADLQVRRITAGTKFNESGRTLSDLDEILSSEKELIHDIPVTIEASKTEGVNPVHQALRETMLLRSTEQVSLQAEEKVISQQLVQYKEDLDHLDKHVYSVNELQRHLRVQTSMYDSLLKNVELARVDEERQNARLARITMIQSAFMPLSQAKPRRLLYTLLACGAGLLVGIAWAFALEFNDSSLKNEEELGRELGYPVLGTLRNFT